MPVIDRGQVRQTDQVGPWGNNDLTADDLLGDLLLALSEDEKLEPEEREMSVSIHFRSEGKAAGAENRNIKTAGGMVRANPSGRLSLCLALV